jgi:hypothetical protein
MCHREEIFFPKEKRRRSNPLRFARTSNIPANLKGIASEAKASRNDTVNDFSILHFTFYILH